MSRTNHNPQHGAPEDAELDGLLTRLAAEPAPEAAREVAAALPSLFATSLLRDRDADRRSYGAWSLVLAPVAAACVCAAALQCLQLRDSALASPHTAALLLAILG